MTLKNDCEVHSAGRAFAIDVTLGVNQKLCF